MALKLGEIECHKDTARAPFLGALSFFEFQKNLYKDREEYAAV